LYLDEASLAELLARSTCALYSAALRKCAERAREAAAARWFQAAARADVSTLRARLVATAGACVGEEEETTGRTALHVLLDASKVEEPDRLAAVGLLISAGSPLGHPAEGHPVLPGASPLHLAVAAGLVDVTRILLESGAPATARLGEGGATPLHVAAAKGRVRCAELLLRCRGVSVNAPQSPSLAGRGAGWTPLHVAAAAGDAKMVRLLLREGGDVLCQDAEGATALDISQVVGPLAVVLQLHDALVAKVGRDLAGELPGVSERDRQAARDKEAEWAAREGARTSDAGRAVGLGPADGTRTRATDKTAVKAATAAAKRSVGKAQQSTGWFW